MYKHKFITLLIVVGMLLSVLAFPTNAQAYTNPAPVDLLTVANFAALAATAVSSPTGGTVLNNGDLGITGVGCTDFPAPCSTPGAGGTVVGGAIQNNNGVATTGQTDATAVVTDLNTRTPDASIGAGLLNGVTLNQGVYDVSSAVGDDLTGDLTLNGDADSIFIFRFNSTFKTSGTARVLFTGGAQVCNVYWTAVSGVTFNGATQMVGTVFAGTSVTFPGGGATVNGRVIAQTAAITFNNTIINRLLCTPTTTTTLSAGNITAGGTAFDSSTLTGDTSTSGGTMTYNIYSDAACTVLAGTAGTKVVTAGVVPNSDPFAFPAAGTYYWQAAYSGDLYNNPSISACTSEILTVTAVAAASSVPGTGFAPNRTTVLPVQPASQAYTAMSDLWLEIPKLGVQMNILGVPPSNGTWDVSWLGKNAGWLQGSAFPTWAGNSVITGHVWNANNTVGPFGYLNTLWWGDKVIIHAWGAQYVYEVRSVQQVGPGSTAAMMRHEELPWVTLVTCRGYDQASNSYKYRVLVRAVLVEVK